NRILISKDYFLIPSFISDQIIKNSTILRESTETSIITPDSPQSSIEPPIPLRPLEPPSPSITPPEQKIEPSVEELTDLNLTMDFDWENLDLLMNLKSLILLLGQKSESLKISVNLDFKGSSKISGMILVNIKKLLKELSEKVNLRIKSNLEDFLKE
ncbi:MAG: hypothetical protein ACTSO4_12325, partial [Promethearchaeota archaeon]